MEFQLATNISDYKNISTLAQEIWTEHYTPIIGIDQVNYMLSKFQSEEPIKNQVNEGYRYYILKVEDSFVGYISIQKREEALFLSKIYILKDFRGKGIGKATMQFIEKQANSLSCSKISLTVNKYNSNSIEAYKKIGFKITETLVMDIGNGYVMDDYKMEKTL